MIVAWCATLLFIAAGSAPLPWLIIGGVLGGIPAAALFSSPGDFLRPESRNAGMGIFYTIYYLGCAVLPTLAGALYDSSGGQAALWMAAATAFLAAATLFAFRRARMWRRMCGRVTVGSALTLPVMSPRTPRSTMRGVDRE